MTTFPFPVNPSRQRVETQITNTSGFTKIGDMTEQGGLAAAFDGTTSAAFAASASKTVTGTTDSTIGIDWGAGVAKTIDRFVCYGANGASSVWFQNGTGTSITVRLEGSNDNTNWMTLYTGTINNSNSSAGPFDSTSSGSVDTSAGYRYHRLRITTTSSGGAYTVSFA